MRVPMIATAMWIGLAASCISAAGGQECDVTGDCASQQLCLGGRCVDDESIEGGRGGEGEGENQKPEGEGEGEDEGPRGGEGEGELVGEGEGEDPRNGCDSCSALQECTENGCEYTGEICEAFDPTRTLRLFETQTAVLDPATAPRHLMPDDRQQSSVQERLVRNHRLTGIPPDTVVRVTVKSDDFDSLLGVYDGSCGLFGHNDNDPDFAITDSRLDIYYPAGASADYVVSHADPRASGGSYTIRAEATYCSKTFENDPALGLSAEEIYFQCRRGFERFNEAERCPSATTPGMNPCARDEQGFLTGYFCCNNSACGNDGTKPITLVQGCIPGGT